MANNLRKTNENVERASEAPPPSTLAISADLNIKNYLDQLDLSYLIKKMTSAHYELPHWPAQLAKTCCQLYKNFLWLNYKYPGQSLVPTRDIDECWHNHILYTENYARDCQAIFGHYLHHRPSDPEDTAEMHLLLEQFANTKNLYQREFGQPLLILHRSANNVG